MNYNAVYEILSKCNYYWGQRIGAQLEYGFEMSSIEEGKYDDLLSKTIDCVYGEYKKNGAITKPVVIKAEKMLLPLKDAAKSKTLLCVAHAHIDMNWQWGFDETVKITLATFRTMLDLMKEYPDFTFSQPQASVYRIVEEYAPDMLKEIKRRIKQGRWEPCASCWVETDKNMPTGEELTRHILYTKKYISRLFDVPEDSLVLDHAPDTFGHSVNVPEILANCGVKYYYHCRGNFAPALYYWEAPSKKRILVFREPTCYNWDIKPTDFKNIPHFSKTYGIDKILRVYGVGDHGGGATRKDIELLKDIGTWPVMPSVKFSTYREFFSHVEELNPRLQTFRGEQNFVFSGCYTSQSRIKAAIRRNAKLFYETEQLMALVPPSSKDDFERRRSGVEEAWTNHLFSHFHDILTGSGKIETREYALAKAQEVSTRLTVEKTDALYRLADKIDTSQVTTGIEKFSIAGGAGVGFDKTAAPNVAEGKKRVYLAYNYGGEMREYVITLTLWDYEGDWNAIIVCDSEEKSLEWEFIDSQPQHYWGHFYRRMLVKVFVPAYGYQTIYVKDNKNQKKPVFYPPIFQRRQDESRLVLENEYLLAQFDPDNASLVYLKNKQTGMELAGSRAFFKFIREEPTKGMSSWVVGQYYSEEPLLKNVKVIEGSYISSPLEQSFSFIADFSNSQLQVKVSLDACSNHIAYDVTCDFFERGTNDTFIPQLGFCVEPLKGARFFYDVPFGVIERKQQGIDVPANSFAGARIEGGTLILTSDSKYGFRAHKDALYIDLIRASCNPDPFPESFRHNFTLKLGLLGELDPADMITAASGMNGSVDVISVRPGKGELPGSGSLIQITGNVAVSSIKPDDSGEGVIVRMYNPDGKQEKVKIGTKAASASLVDGLERQLSPLEVTGGSVAFDVPAYSSCAVKLR